MAAEKIGLNVEKYSQFTTLEETAENTSIAFT